MPDNIVVIAVDDQFEHNFFRTHLGSSVLTPNMDRLRDTGTLFSNAFSLVPICMPSRAATFTGWSPARSGVIANGDKDWFDRIPVRDNIGAMLRRAGYRTGFAGKIMHSYAAQPLAVRRQIHDDFLPNLTFQPDTTPGTPGVIHYHPEVGDCISVEGKDEQFYDYQVAQWGIDRMDVYKDLDQPWALFLGFKHPHNSLEAPKWAYDAVDREGLVPPPGWLEGRNVITTEYGKRFSSYQSLGWLGTERWEYNVWAYYAAIYHVDHHIGRVLDALDAKGLSETTTVILLSDHGFTLGHRSWWGKFTLWEESARTPLYVRKAGQTTAAPSDVAVSLMDVMPTILDAAGIPIPKRLPGQSLMNLMPGGAGTYEDRGAITFVHGSAAVKHGSWRYILYPNDEEELYNLDTDVDQHVNLAGDNPKTHEMRQRLVIEMARYDMVQASSILPTAREAVTAALFSGDVHEIGHSGGTAHLYGFSDEADMPTLTTKGGRSKIMLGGWAHNVPFRVPEWLDDFEVRVPSGGSVNVGAPIHMNDRDNVVFNPQYPANVYGYGGDDYIESATQLIDGGRGNDTIVGGPGGTLIGGPGDDTISGGTIIRAGSGDDTIRSPNPAGATIHLHSGNNDVVSSPGNDTIYGGTGNDKINARTGNNVIHTGPGQNELTLANGNNTLHLQGDTKVTVGTGANTYIVGRYASLNIAGYQSGQTIDLTAWGVVEPTFTQTSAAAVRIYHRNRSVFVNSMSPLTVAQVQAAVVLAT